jgi:hypothetical protein
MQLYVYDDQRRLAGVVESFSYFSWRRRYADAGTFELTAAATIENLALLQIGYLIRKPDDSEAAFIESLAYTLEDGETVTVAGRFATSLLARRIIWHTENVRGDLAAAIGQLLDHNLLNPDISDPDQLPRKMTGISYSPVATGFSVNNQLSYRNLLEGVIKLCEMGEYGFRTNFDPHTGLVAFELYKGRETSATFAREYDNITRQQYIHNLTDSANVGRGGGEGEGKDRVFTTVGDMTVTGYNRREAFVDARDLQSEGEDGSVLTPAEYMAKLRERTLLRLDELRPVESFDAAVNPYGGLRYKQDYDLGDVVTILSRRWGVSMRTRITEVEEIYDVQGMTLDVTFGHGLLTLSQKLKEVLS